MNRLLGLALAALSLSVIPSANAQERVDLSQPSSLMTVPLTLAPIQCKNPGSSQDIAKTPYLVNATSSAIPTGTMLFWKSSDGDSGEYKLTAPLAPNASVKMMGKAGQVYTCQGSLTSWPDLVVKKASVGASSAVIEIANTDAYADANASVAKIELFSCSSGNLQTSAISVPLTVPKGSTRTFTIPVTHSGRVFIRATADAQKSVSEKSEFNNTWAETMNACLY
jgi:hypothetical protein